MKKTRWLLVLAALLQLGACAADVGDDSNMGDDGVESEEPAPYMEEADAELDDEAGHGARQKAVSGYLRILKVGTGLGTVVGDDGLSLSINCGSRCQVQYLFGAMITLTATPMAGHSFGGWRGAGSCTTNPVCTVMVPTSGLDVTATFNAPPPPPAPVMRSLSLTYAAGVPANPGTPANSSRFNVVRNDTGASLSFPIKVPHGTTITITPITFKSPTSAEKSVWFRGWNSAGACASFGRNPCIITMTSNRSAQGVFCYGLCQANAPL